MNNNNTSKSELIEYVRNKHGQRIGVVVARPVQKEKDTYVGVGWSLCKTKLDSFDNEIALNIARGRTETGTKSKLPHTVESVFTRMINRAERYFKGYSVMVAAPIDN